MADGIVICWLEEPQRVVSEIRPDSEFGSSFSYTLTR
jgi:hypothetical protein